MEKISWMSVLLTATLLGVITLVLGIWIGKSQEYREYADLKGRCDGQVVLVEGKDSIGFKCTFKN